MAQQKEYTWDDLVAAVGQDFSGGQVQTGVDPADWSGIRRFCEPIEMDCPLHHDDAVARQHGYKGIIAPVGMINQTLTTPAYWSPGDSSPWPAPDRDAMIFWRGMGGMGEGLPMPPTTAGFATDIDIEYLAPVYVGDQLTVKGRKLISAIPKQTSVGFGAFIVFESYIYNQRGELVATQRNGVYQYNPHPTQ